MYSVKSIIVEFSFLTMGRLPMKKLLIIATLSGICMMMTATGSRSEDSSTRGLTKRVTYLECAVSDLEMHINARDSIRSNSTEPYAIDQSHCISVISPVTVEVLEERLLSSVLA
jgi:hypothetical protein